MDFQKNIFYISSQIISIKHQSMNKEDLINSIHVATNISKKEIKLFIDSFCDTVSDSLSKGEKVTLFRFGSWDIQHLAARKGRNPRTGAPIEIKAKKKVRFKAGAELSGTVN